MKVNKSMWKMCQLGDICTNATSNISISKTKIGKGDYPLFGASGIVGNIDFYHQEKEYIGIVKDGSGVGRVNKYPPKSSLVGTMQYIFPKDNISIDFLKYLLISLNLAKYVKGAAIPHIYFRHYKSEKILLPKITEQESIASELDALQEVIDGYRDQIADLDALAQSIFLDTFGDPISNPRGWDVKQLQEIVTEDCKLSYGIVQPGDEVLNGIPVVRSIDMSSPVIYLKNLKRVDPSIAQKYQRTKLIGDEIFISCRGITGVISLASEELKGGNITRGLVSARLKLGERLFVYYCLRMPQINRIIQEKTKGATLRQINVKDIRLLPIIFPPIDMQKAFAAQMDSINLQNNLLRQQLADAEMLMAERMQYYFS